MASKWCELFTVGTHTDKNGRQKTWTYKDLDEITANLKKNPDVPLVIGHPTGTAPAWGWVEELQRVGGSLYGKFKQVQPEFKEWVRKGLYKTRSIAVDKNNVLKHIAFLGATAPAVKGMKSFCFNESEDDFYLYFSEEKEESEDIAMNEAEVQIQEKDAEIKHLKEELKKEKDAKKEHEFSEFCEEQIREGHILPAQKEMIKNLLQACEESAIQSFSEGENTKTPLQMFQEFVKSLPKNNLTKELAKKEDADPAKSISEFSADEVKDGIIEIQQEYKNKGQEIDVAKASQILCERNRN